MDSNCSHVSCFSSDGIQSKPLTILLGLCPNTNRFVQRCLGLTLKRKFIIEDLRVEDKDRFNEQIK